MRGIYILIMFQSETDFWGGTWIRRKTPFREAWVQTPLMAFPCVHGLTTTPEQLTFIEAELACFVETGSQGAHHLHQIRVQIVLSRQARQHYVAVYRRPTTP
jgi:hypothetical protein